MLIDRKCPHHAPAAFAAGAFPVIPNLHIVIVLPTFQEFVDRKAPLNFCHIFRTSQGMQAVNICGDDSLKFSLLL